MQPINAVCLNCRAPFTFTPAHPIEEEIYKRLGACCPACCRYAYSK